MTGGDALIVRSILVMLALILAVAAIVDRGGGE